MRTAHLRAVAAGSLLAAVLVPSGAASATAPGPGTFTRITTPSKDLRVNVTSGTPASFSVIGTTSLDVTTVDIDCVLLIAGAPNQSTTLASSVPVTNGQFSTTAVIPSTPPTNCRLRAVPAGIDPESGDYLGSYTGPILYTNVFGLIKAGSVPYSFSAFVEEGDGAAIFADAGTCEESALVTVQRPQMTAGPIVISCGFSLPPNNQQLTGAATRSAIQIDGRNAYLPSGVHSYLVQDLALPVTQSPLSVTRHVAANGDTTVTEAATLLRCSHANTVPPTATSCPSLVSTGVRFTRVSVVFRDGHQIKIRDSFTSTDHHAHHAALQYLGAAINESGGGNPTGTVGYSYPGHSSSFHAANLGQSVTGLGSRAATVLVRSDLYARSDEPTADTLALTWSHAPSTIMYSTGASNVFAMQTSVSVPSGGIGFLGFAMSERWSTADVKALAALAVQDMMPAPHISSPRNGLSIKGKTTKVTGTLTAGANGLPTAVKVNGHAATITRHSATSASYAVQFTESLGRHTITVTATDLAGNARSAAVKIRNS